MQDEDRRHDVAEADKAPQVRMGPDRSWTNKVDMALAYADQRAPGLRTIVSTVVACPLPMFLAWGRNLIFIPNDAAVLALGPLALEGIGKPIDRALARIWPQVGPLATKAAEGLGSSAHDLPLDLGRSGEDGESWWNIMCSPVSHDEDDAVAGLIGTLQETTEAFISRRTREAAATRLRHALAAGDKIGAWDWDVTNNRMRSDRTFALFYCIDPDLARTGIPPEEYIKCLHRDDRAMVQNQIKASIKTGETFYSEHRLLWPSGETHWVCAQGKPEYDAAGNCVRFPGISFDITINKLNNARRRRHT